MDMEALVNTLKVALVLLIVFVLWKRLKVFLFNGTNNNAYAKLTKDHYEVQDGKIHVEFWLPAETNVVIELKNNYNKQITTSEINALPKGEHAHTLDVKGFPSGKHSFTFKTSNQNTERFFDVV